MPPSPLPLTTVTADSIKQSLIDSIVASFPDWTDQQDSDSMVMLLEQVAGVGEMCYAYINRMAREAFIMFAIDPRNVVAHAQGLGYTPRYQVPATVSAVLVSGTPVTADTVIPAGSQFATTLAGIVYETTQDAVIPAGQTVTPPVILNQQESWYDNFVGTGQPTQMIPLNHGEVMPTSIQVIVDGAVWNYVTDFIDSSATSNDFTWFVDSNGNGTVVFGNGINGRKPVVSAAGRVFYKTGGGTAGAISAGQLSACLNAINDAGTGQVISVSGLNTSASTPGADPETIDQIRKHAIANLQAPRVLLTLTDIQTAVGKVAGVSACLAINWTLQDSLPHHVIQVFVVPVGLGAPSAQLLADINDVFLDKPVAMGTVTSVLAASYRALNFNIQVFALPGYNQTTVQNAVASQLSALFNPASPENIWKYAPAFGMGVYMSQLVAILQQIPGVRNLVMLAPGDTQLNLNEFPQLGTVTFV